MPPRRQTYPNQLYFVTLTIQGWVDLFTRHIYSDLLIENLDYCIKNKGLHIYYYCIMHNHVHMIAAADEGSLNSVLAHFKSYTSKQILNKIDTPGESRKEWLLYLFQFFSKKFNQDNKVWQEHNYPVALFGDKVIQQKIDYIHLNPVKAGIVNRPEAYIYSSANPGNPLNEVIG